MISSILTNYSPTADIGVACIAIAVEALMLMTFSMRHSKNKKLLHVMTICMAIAPLLNIISIYSYNTSITVSFVVRTVYYGILLVIFYGCLYYYTSIVILDNAHAANLESYVRRWPVFGSLSFCIISALGIFICGIERYMLVESCAFIFIGAITIGFLLYMTTRHIIFFIASSYKMIYLAVTIVSFMVLMTMIRMDYTYACLIYAIPVLSFSFFIRDNSYDIDSGGIVEYVFSIYLKTLENKGLHPCILSLHIISGEGASPAVKKSIFRACHSTVEDGHLFKITDLRYAYVSYGHDVEHQKILLRQLSNSLIYLFKTNNINYKLHIFDADRILDNYSYRYIMQHVESTMDVDTLYEMNEDDINELIRESTILNELESVVNNDDVDDPRLLIYFQPIYDMEEDCINSIEVLTRLETEEMGLIQPDEFIHIAENNNLIHPITFLILKKACDFVAQILGDGYDLKKFSINLSVEDIKDPLLINKINQIVDSYSIPRKVLSIEITEGLDYNDKQAFMMSLDSLHKMGYDILLDDFGTGYSNLERMLMLPFQVVKIDRFLIRKAQENEQSRKSLADITNFIINAGYKVLYEGIENEEDEKMAKSLGAHYLQGYRYAKPLPIMELKSFLNKKSKQGLHNAG